MPPTASTARVGADQQQSGAASRPFSRLFNPPKLSDYSPQKMSGGHVHVHEDGAFFLIRNDGEHQMTVLSSFGDSLWSLKQGAS